jgi:hypothetical protein
MTVFPATGSIVVAVLLVCLLVIKSSKVYRKTLRAVRDYDGTTDRLGTPVLPGLLVMGNMSRMPSGLMVSLTVPVFGPRDQATVFAVAHRKGGDWHFTTLQLQDRNSSVHIDLLESVKSG